ncbi:hypothetical protein [Pseudonocardia sp. DLS-67]
MPGAKPSQHLGISRAKRCEFKAGKHPAKPQDITVLCGLLQTEDGAELFFTRAERRAFAAGARAGECRPALGPVR